ncbi:MAG: hypothetical protein U5K77_02825 [Candidatus Saccharibacteria bacterium]|nr:hypothetical protein [Candidatus Saccharibacteria bacterium]
MEQSPCKEDKLWSGADNIVSAFEADGEPYDVPLVSYLNGHEKVVVKNDPALIKVFGEETVAMYERLLAEAE